MVLTLDKVLSASASVSGRTGPTVTALADEFPVISYPSDAPCGLAFVLRLAQAHELHDTGAQLGAPGGDHLFRRKVGLTGPGTMSEFGIRGPILGYPFENENRCRGGRVDSDE